MEKEWMGSFARGMGGDFGDVTSVHSLSHGYRRPGARGLAGLGIVVDSNFELARGLGSDNRMS